ncbi:MAG: hypothetical protein HFK08_03675 [Clostridia bacterium]|nr:hypothetical protein [Clostridia bacterium]
MQDGSQSAAFCFAWKRSMTVLKYRPLLYAPGGIAYSNSAGKNRQA